MNMIEYFDQVRIVNMAIRTDRRDETVEEFGRNGFPINTDKVSFFEAIAPSEAKGFPNPGARGCFLSHLTIIEEAINAKANHLFILEDDVQFSKHIAKHGAEAVKSLQNMDWDIAYFGHALDSASGEVEWKPVDQPMLQSHCYAVNGQCLEKLATYLKQMMERPAGHPDGGPMHYDGALNTFMNNVDDVKAYYFSINLGYQRPSKTNIHQTAFYDQNPMLSPLINIARRIKAAFLRFMR